MQHFTHQETISPSEKTLNTIRQFAYACNLLKHAGGELHRPPQRCGYDQPQ